MFILIVRSISFFVSFRFYAFPAFFFVCFPMPFVSIFKSVSGLLACVHMSCLSFPVRVALNCPTYSRYDDTYRYLVAFTAVQLVYSY